MPSLHGSILQEREEKIHLAGDESVASKKEAGGKFEGKGSWIPRESYEIAAFFVFQGRKPRIIRKAGIR